MRETETDECTIRNLEKAGCCEKTIQAYLECKKKGNTAAQINLLSRQREDILDDIHEKEGKISALDYLVYELEKKEKEI